MPTHRNNHAQPQDAIAMLKADHQKVRISFTNMRPCVIRARNGRWLNRSSWSWKRTRSWKRTSSTLR